jgi:UDP-glucose 4-epimerase
VLNLGTRSGHSVWDVIVMVERVSGCAVSVRLGPRRAGDPPILVADASRAHQVLNWQPINSDLERIVLTAWRWHEQNHRRASSRSTLDSLSPYQKSRTR